MKNLLLSLILLFTSVAYVQPTCGYSDIELNKYVEKFIDISNGAVSADDFYDVSIKFAPGSNFEPSVVGTCLVAPFFREIEINSTWWLLNNSELEREELMFHELGHCILYRPHTDPDLSKGFKSIVDGILFKLGLLEKKGYLSDGCPESYMHPYTIGEKCVKKHYNHYAEELFSTDKEEIVVFDETIIDFTCTFTEIVNKTDKWTNFDERTLKRAKNKCITMYDSCLKKFIKKEKGVYNAICG